MDNDFPTVMGGKDFLTSYLEKYGGGEQYSQTGTDIPTFSVGRDFEGGEGTGIPPYFMEEISSTPAWGGVPQQAVPKEQIEKLQQPVKSPGEPFFDQFRQQYGLPSRGVEQAEAPRFIRIPPDIDSPAADRWLREHPSSSTDVLQQFLRNKPAMQEKYRGIGGFGGVSPV
jgi:hypothetical protein